MNEKPYYQQLHDEILEEEASTIIESLGEDYARIIQITKTDKGVQIVECCDGYYGTTLSENQVRRLIKELEELITS